MALYGPCTRLLIGLHIHKNIHAHTDAVHVHTSLNIHVTHARTVATHWGRPVNVVLFPSPVMLIPVRKRVCVALSYVFVFCLISSCWLTSVNVPLSLVARSSVSLWYHSPLSLTVFFQCVDKVKLQLSVMCRAL